MLARLREGWSAVGPAFVSGNRMSNIAIAANILTYGQWMGQKHSREVRVVSGYISAFPVELLLSRGSSLSEDLVAPSTLQMSLARQGHRFFLETDALMAHWESSGFSGAVEILGKNGYGLGMLRARELSIFLKILLSSLNPVLSVHRFARATGAHFRLKHRSIKVLLILIPLAFIWSVGELFGYWRGGRNAIKQLSDVERNRQRYVDSQREPIEKPF
jgi:hypothetical protein